MARITKLDKLASLTSDYLEAVDKLFPDDKQLEKALSTIALTNEDKKMVKSLKADLDLLSTLVIASILGY